MPYQGDLNTNWFSGYKPKQPDTNKALERINKKLPPKDIEYHENQIFFIEPHYLEELERLCKLNQILDGYKYDSTNRVIRFNQKITTEKRNIIQNLIITAKKNIGDLPASTR